MQRVLERKKQAVMPLDEQEDGTAGSLSEPACNDVHKMRVHWSKPDRHDLVCKLLEPSER